MKKLLTFLVLMLAIVSMNAQPFANAKANPKRTQMLTQPSVQMAQMDNAQVRTDQMPTTVSAIETNDVQKQIKQALPLKGKSRTTETRLGATTTDRFLQSATSVPTDAMGLLARSNTKNADLELTYLGGDLNNVLGNDLTGVRHISGCISFTAAQMTNFVGGTLHTIAVPLPGTNNMNDATGAKVWIKNSLSGAIIQEQTFTIEYGGWNIITLNTPHVIQSGSFVIGFTVSFNRTQSSNASMRPLWCSSNTTDSYKEGGFNYIIATNATAHESGATWNTFESLGNLGITGLVSGVSLPDNDLAATLLTTNNTIQVAGSPYTYTVAVSNAGTATQNNYTVQLIDAADNVLASQAMTTALAEGAFTNVNLNYTPTTAGDLTLRGKVVLAGDEVAENDITEPVTFRVYPLPPMHYCTYEKITNGVGINNPATLNAAIGFPTSAMDPFAERLLTTIEVGLNEPPSMLSNCVVWIRSSLTGSDLYSQPFTPVEGWNTIQLTTPYLLQNENTFIGYTLTTTGGFPLGTTNNTQNAANGGHLGMEGDWFTLSDVPLSGNWAIIGTVIDDPNATCTPVSNLQASYNGSCNAVLTWTASDVPGATYNVYRGATQIATGIAATTYTDVANDEFQGYTWSVRAICGSEESIARTVSLPYCTDPCGDFVITIGTTPWTEGFEGTEFPPQCWSINTLNPSYDTWEGDHYAEWAHTGIGYALHVWTEEDEYQESWLITPAIQLPLDGICELSFWSRWMWSAYTVHNGVWISETDKNPGSFTLLETITPILVSGNGVLSAWREDVVPLAAYAGKTVYIAFKYTGDDGNLWMLDDVSIKKLVDNDVELVAITQPNSGANLSNAEQVTVTLKNSGSTNITSVGLELFLNNTSQGTATWTGDLASGATANYTFTPTLDLSAAATYEVKVVATMANDANPANNTVVKNVTNIIVNAQSIPFYENFNATTDVALFPVDWTTTLPPAPELNRWFTSTGVNVGSETTPLPVYARDGRAAYFITDYETGSNAWLTTPGLILEEGKLYRMNFNGSMYNDGEGDFENFRVVIGTSVDNAVVTGTTIFQSNANTGLELSLGWTDLVTSTFTAPATGVYFIGIHINNPVDGGWWLAIDDIAVREVLTNDLEIVVGRYYTQIPVAQASSIKPSARATNVGLTAQTNVKLSGTVDGTSIGESTPVASIAPNATSATMSFASNLTSFATTGNKQMVLTVAGDQANEGTRNTATINFTATENTYAMDTITVPTLVASAPEGFVMGNIFEITKGTWIKQISAGFGVSDPLAIRLFVYRMTNATTTEAEPLLTKDVTRSATGFIAFDMSETYLAPGLYYVAVVQVAVNGDIAVCYQLSPNFSSYTRNSTGALGGIVVGGDPIVVAVRMIIDDDYDPGAIAVLSTTPDNNATDVAIDAVVKVTYDQPITAVDLSGVAISPDPGGVSASISNNELIIAHSNFEENVQYTVTIPVGAIENYATATTWTFKTVAPKVASTMPANNATQVAANATVRVIYDRPVVAGTAPLTGVTISPDPGGVVATISGSQLNIAHNNFAEHTEYTVTVPANTIKNYETDLSWSFGTVSPWIQPQDLTADVNGRNVKISWTLGTVYSEGFEGVEVGQLPAGWTSANDGWHASNRAPGILGDVDPYNGTRGLGTPWDAANASANPWAFSSGISLTGGTTYDVSFWYMAPGYNGPPVEYDRFRVYMSQTASISGMTATTPLFTHGGTTRTAEWVQFKGTFTPSTTGTYHLGFQQFSETRNGLSIFIDDILITAQGAEAKFNVYLDGEQKAPEITEYEYTFTNLEGGTYIAGVEAVYTDGVSLRSNIEFSIVGDLGISALVSPESGNLCNETIVVTVRNYGAIPVEANIPITYQVLNLGTNALSTPVTQSFAINLNPNATQNVTFTTQANLSAAGTSYEIIAYPSFPGDGNRANDTLRETVLNFTGCPGSIGELADGSNIGIYPNPVSEKLFISADEPIKRAEIYDISGRLVKVVQGDVKDIEVSDLRSGTYIVRFITDKGVVSLRFVKE